MTDVRRDCATCGNARTLFRDVEEIACFDCCEPDGSPLPPRESDPEGVGSSNDG